jgi:sialate O-acetylesterase
VDAFSTVDNSAFIREAQLKCADLIPNSGIAITLDIGDKYSIHPPKKKEVADRLLYNALNQTYGFETIDGKSPVFDTMEIRNGEVLLKFKNAETGLYAFNELTGFEVAGEDRVFYPAHANIEGRRNVLVVSDKVTSPVAVRYAWSNWVEGSLFDTNLLPASSFRTDDWEDATRRSE